ncbi:MAG: hypothetical protein EBS83_14625, partial [Planctomycetia bacterium]|nr:hypothetical protein [Planctomycetia bacterium]
MPVSNRRRRPTTSSQSALALESLESRLAMSATADTAPESVTISTGSLPTLLPQIEVSHFG